MYNGIMSIKSSFIFSLILLDEIMSQLRDPLGAVSFSYKNMYGFVPSSYKKKNVYGLVERLKNEGLLKSEAWGNFSLRLEARKVTFKDFPLLQFVGKPWDGKWRIFGFDIEEKQRFLRTRLRNILHKYGFRMVQKSLYVCPLPTENHIKEFILEYKELSQNTYMFISDKFFFEHEKEFVDKIFHLTELNSRYKALLKKLQEDESKEKRADALREFIQTTSNDYFLPKELLTENFLRDKAASLLNIS